MQAIRFFNLNSGDEDIALNEATDAKGLEDDKSSRHDRSAPPTTATTSPAKPSVAISASTSNNGNSEGVLDLNEALTGKGVKFLVDGERKFALFLNKPKIKQVM